LVDLQNKSSSLSPNEVVNSTPVLLTSTKNSNYSLSSMQSSTSPLKLIIKSSTVNGFASISNNNDDEPIKKKQRIEDLSSLVPSYSHSNSIDEQSVPSSSSLTNNIQKKKKKKKFHQHHPDDNNRNHSSSSSIPSLITNGQHRKNKKHRHHRQLSSPSSREPL